MSGEFTEALEEIDHNSIENKNKNCKLFLTVCKSRIMRLEGRFKDAIENLDSIKEEIVATSDDFLISSLYSELSWSLRFNGELKLCQSIIELSQGPLSRLENNESSFVRKKYLDYKANSLHIKAVILLEKEDINSALKTAYESLIFRKEIGVKHGIADSMNNIGVMHWYNGELDLAMENFVETLELRKLSNNPMLQALVLSNIVQLNVQRGGDYLPTALKYYKEFEIFTQDDESDIQQVKNYFQFAKAVYLKSSTRFKHRAEAEKIFYELIEKDELDLQNTFFAYYYLAELLFFELKSTGDEEILQEIRVLVENLTKIGEEREMKVVLSRSYLLQSKIMIIDGDIERAKKCLNMALNIAVGANDNRLLHQITSEWDELFAEEKDLLAIDQNTPIAKRIQAAHLEEMGSQFSTRTTSVEGIEGEKPILFLIMVDIGTLVYSKIFEARDDFNENLVSNFIGAINNFGNEIFSSSGFIDRINHKDYTILMKPGGIFIFSYVFKGSSFSPSKKLNEISDKIMDFDFIQSQDVERRIITMTNSNKQLINSLVEGVILST
ncbi:MAG: tetratricopeptide repeat protein [Candidatus Heimdallarchaeota archaeon]|nr:tetratricopeptide repeat protein [Candidatus Heimdallarchaeota archaeon]